jgi:hypothetical protein
MRPNQILRTRTDHLGDSFNAEFDDEFDGNLFDGVDVSEGHGILLRDSICTSTSTQSHRSGESGEWFQWYLFRSYVTHSTNWPASTTSTTNAGHEWS